MKENENEQRNKETDKQILGNRNKKKKPFKMRETMKTLEQIRKEKKMKVGIPLTDKEQDECVKEWLQQKLNEYSTAWSNEGQACFDAINELLEELKQ